MFFSALIIIVSIAIYIEEIVPIGTPGSGIRRGTLHFFLAMIGAFVWARILLHMIAFPEKYLPERSLTLDAEIYGRREKFIQCIGYALGIATIIYAIYQIVTLIPALKG